ncbi:MAG: acyl-CoA dehydrogenase family protein [Myxococcales bacterium]|nr:acyl-CoA/acyl-ACP dehydrogenase [Myxococcota bacterium]MDW8281400.1 acyl-CoA dehydrogenase family protein [Myxococcales bacterium]
MISFALDDDQRLLQDTVRRFCREVLREQMRRHEQQGGLLPEVEQAFAELGLIDLELDEGLPHRTAALVHEELAWGDPGAAVALWTPHLCAGALRELGTPEQQARLLARLRRGPDQRYGRGAVAYAEGGPGQGATVAVPTRGGYVLSGTKRFVLHAPQAELTIVFAQLDGGCQGMGAFAIAGRPAADPQGSFRLGQRHELLGLRAAPAGELVLQEHLVPEEDRLRGGDDFCAAARRVFARAQLLTAARQVGLARAAYELALSYTQDRRAFGKPVAHFQAVAFALAEVHMEVESARWLLWQAAAEADAGRLDLALCAGAAAHACEAAFCAADWCVQLLGGAGFMEDFPAEKWLREAKALALVGGTPQLYEQIVAAQVLGQDPEGNPEGAGLPSPRLQPFLT